MKKRYLLIIFLITSQSIFSQEKLGNSNTTKYILWALLQLLPSPTLYQDSDNKNWRLQFGFQWHLTPINVSFDPNKYVSPVQFFFIYPARRFSGSAEIFIQPELSTASFRYADLSIFGISTGPRIIIPVAERGENLSFSLAGKYTYRKNFYGEKNYYYGVEAGIYVFGGIAGLQYTQNFNSRTKFNISFYLKYF